jgi:hypothetical protein
MSWEQRNGRGLYYTHSRRENGRMVRDYYGKGELAQITADLDAIGRQARLLERDARAEERAWIAAVEDPLVEFGRAVDLAVSSELLVAGYHRHDRGPWRRRRGQR